jgi:hypothetical protein
MTKRQIAALKGRRTLARKQLAVNESKLRELGAVLSDFGRRLYTDHIFECTAEIDSINYRLRLEGAE